MRIPKFRAWLKNDKKLVDVVAINFNLKTVFIKVDDAMNYDVEAYDFNDIELMQSTGLFDKNGVETFEGDIVKTPDLFFEKNLQIKGKVYRVFKDKSMFGLVTKENDVGYIENKDGVFEVIGNIFENPELLESEVSNGDAKIYFT